MCMIVSEVVSPIIKFDPKMSYSLFTRCLFYHLHNRLTAILEHNYAKGLVNKVCLSSQSITQVSPILQPEQWQIMAAVCLERKPLLTQQLTPLETRFSALLTQLEHERSMLSDHELQHIEDIKRAEKLKRGDEDIDIDAATKQTAQDFEDTNLDELQSFKALGKPRNTGLHTTDDLHSFDRKLKSNLLLIMKERLGNDYKWILPQTVWREGENLRESAERTIKEICGDNPQVTIMSNSPCGFYKYKYPKAVRDSDTIGAKVFFFKAHIQSRNLNLHTNVGDYAWVTRTELKEMLQLNYRKAIERFLIDEHSEM